MTAKNMEKPNFNKIKNLVQQVLNTLAKKAYLFFLFLIIFYFILGGVLIYKYGILAERTEIYTIEKKQNILKKNTYEKILEHWRIKKIEFDKIDEKIYSNPFIEKKQKLDDAPIVIASEGELQPERAKQSLPLDEQKKEDLSSKAPEEAKEEPTAKSFFGKINTLFDYYVSQGKNFLSINERAEIWEQEGLGETEEYHGFYNQNIKLLEQLTK